MGSVIMNISYLIFQDSGSDRSKKLLNPVKSVSRIK